MEFGGVFGVKFGDFAGQGGDFWDEKQGFGEKFGELRVKFEDLDWNSAILVGNVRIWGENWTNLGWDLRVWAGIRRFGGKLGVLGKI